MERQKAAKGGNGLAAICRLLSMAVAAVYSHLPSPVNAAKRFSTPFNVSRSRGKSGPHKWLIFGLVQPISGFFSHDTYPASDGEPGCLAKVCGVRQMPPVKMPQGCAGEVMHRRPNET
jgi:hypothetical protein